MERVNEQLEQFGVWALAAPEAPDLPCLNDSLNTGTLVIGGGYTGLFTALDLARQGENVALVEAVTPGWGESGRNTGWVEPNWWMKSPAWIESRFGPAAGQALSRWVAAGADGLNDLIQSRGLQVEWRQSGLVMASNEPATVDRLRSEAADWQRLGVEFIFLDAQEMESFSPTRYFRGGLLLANGGTLNPLALVNELTRACLQQGVRCFSHTPAIALRNTSSGWLVSTPAGEVRARRLVLATGGSPQQLFSEVSNAQYPWLAAVAASRPYPHMAELLRRSIPVADLDLKNVFTLRNTGDNRLVTSLLAPLTGRRCVDQVVAPFMRKFRRIYPDLPEPEWEYVHYGKVANTRDMMPRLSALGDNAWTCYGYSGTGINYSFLLGRELSRLARGQTGGPGFPLQPIPTFRSRRLVAAVLKYLLSPLSRQVLSRC